ncbi:hypothetical protein QR680_014785 [Steinernema hermaphroditum]|uniref:Dynamin GTPase n=1 Tax=Steinernema hermaphroditum TaxID=289476 RepID=A0AA39M4V3_9BILA|nr:hypothetical protein QR680_014785 [Steinernema hermaphroditum]
MPEAELLSSDDYGQQLILLLNKFQDLSTKLGDTVLDLDLPQIAVVGVQSAGKSSILENFVGKDFLPRGSGVVTRRPLFLQLINDPEERGVFLHKPNEKFTDFNKIRMEIERETDRTTGSNKGISNVPINLKIYSPNVLNLTLVDLPGITRVAQGDQSQDIETVVKEQGYIGVVNRSQEGINSRVSMQAAIEKETKFFLEKYPSIANKQGTLYLRQFLNHQLAEHIRLTLPNLINSVRHKQLAIEEELKLFDHFPQTAREKRRLITDLLNEVLDDVESDLGNNLSRPGQITNLRTLNGGAKVKLNFTVDFAQEVDAILMDEAKMIREICMAVLNTTGVRRGHFIAEKVFEDIVRQEIERLKEPSRKTAERVAARVTEVLRKAVAEKMRDYPILRNTAVQDTDEFVRTCEKIAKERIENEFEYENALIWTEHIHLETSQIMSTIEWDGDFPDESFDGISLNWHTLTVGQEAEPGIVVDADSDTEIVSYGYSRNQQQQEKQYKLDRAVLRHYKPGDRGEEEELFLFYEGLDAPERYLQLSIDDDHTADDWLLAFQNVGFYPWSPNNEQDRYDRQCDDYTRMDTLTSKEVKAIKIMVEQFMEVETKTIKTIIPKIVVHMIVDKQKPFLRRTLLNDLQDDADNLLKEAPDVKAQRTSLNGKMEMCRQIMELTKEMNSLANSASRF